MENLKLPQLNNKEEVMAFLKEAPVQLAEVVTGVLGSEMNEWKMSAGRIVQSALKGSLLTQLGRELGSYREKGEIKEDFLTTDNNRMSLYELLKMIDSDDIPDEVKYRAAKSIFINGIKSNATAEDEALSYEFLKTVKSVSGTEVSILKANFEIAKGKGKPELTSTKTIFVREVWFKYIAIQMNIPQYTSMIEKYEPNLISLGLISIITAGDGSGFRHTNYFRLTDMGYKFCEFMTNYED